MTSRVTRRPGRIAIASRPGSFGVRLRRRHRQPHFQVLGVDDGRNEVIEERGFDSLVVAEHTHIPTSRDTPYPLGGQLPR